MPLDPFVATRLHLIPDAAVADLVANPATRAEVFQSSLDDRPYEPRVVGVREETIEGPAGRLAIRVYSPITASVQKRPALVWVHGGGFVGGTLDMREGDLVGRELCARAQAIIVSVDYHVADGATITYPQLHREVLAALRWTRVNANVLGIGAEAISLGGASAGGSLSVSATLELVALGEQLPAQLILAYPALHPTNPRSDEVLHKTLGLPRGCRFEQSDLDYFFSNYVGTEGVDNTYLSPEDHSLVGFPPCLIIVNEYDDLRASGEAFAAQAVTNGVPVTVYKALGMLHGHLGMTPLVPEVHNTLQVIADALTNTLPNR